MSILGFDKSTSNETYDVDCVSANSFGDTESYVKRQQRLLLQLCCQIVDINIHFDNKQLHVGLFQKHNSSQHNHWLMYYF
nr:MAG TPA: hypothetical protein [Caudoviricetes sp.]